MIRGYSRPYIIINNLYAMGGAERNVLNVFRTTTAQDQRPIIVTSQKPLPREPFDVLRTIYVGETFTFISAIVWVIATLVLIVFSTSLPRKGNCRPSVIHGYMSVPSGLVAVLAGKLLRCPSIVSIQGQDLFFFRFPILDVLHRFVLQHVDHIITQTAWQREYILQRISRSPLNITVLANGVLVPSSYSPLPAIKNPRRFQLLFLGRFIPQKSPIDAIEAIRLIRELNPKVTVSLTMVGYGPMEPLIRAKIKEYNLDPFISIQKPIPHNQVSNLIQQHDAILLPSRSEGMPNAILEAMALARPVVVTAFPGVHEYVNNNVTGLISEVGNLQQLAQNIMQLAKAPVSASQLGINGRTWILEKLELTQIVKQQLQLYDKLSLQPRLDSRHQF